MDQNAILDQLAADPKFQAASKDEQVQMAMDAMTSSPPEPSSPGAPNDERRAIPNGERPSPLSFGGAAATVVEGAAQAAGGYLARKGAAKVLQAQPHPVGKAIGVGLEFLGGVGGSSAAGAGAAAGRAAITGEDAGSAALRGAEEGAVGELGGRVLETGFKGAAKLIAGNKISPEAATDLAAAEKRGIQLRPAEVSESTPAAMLEQTARRSIVSGNKFDLTDAKNATALKSWTEDLAKQHFGGLKSPAEVGETVKQVLRGESIPALKAQQQSMYQILDKIKDVRPVESQALLDQLLTLKTKAGASPQAQKAIDMALNIVATKSVQNGKLVPKGMTFSEAHELRSVLNEVGRDHTEIFSDRLGAVAKQIANGPLFDSMEAAARRSGPETFTRWRAADQFTKDLHGLLDTSAIRQALNASPEDVVGATFKGNQVTETKKVLNALMGAENPKEAVSTYRSGAMSQLLQQASADGAFDPARLVAASKKYSPELLEATFGKKFMADFDELIHVAKRLNRSAKPNVAGNPSQTARGAQNATELMLAGSAATGALMGAPGGLISLGAVALSMNQMARVMNSPGGIQMLKRGLLIKPETAEAAKLVPRIMAIALGETLLPE
jgi:hypothetical protein